MTRLPFMIAACLVATAPAWAGGTSTDEAANDAIATVATDVDIDLEAAERIYQRSCRACHGNDAMGASSYPSLADKEKDYIVEQLERYRAGERIGPNSILMISNARTLSDQDIASLAAYITTAFEARED